MPLRILSEHESSRAVSNQRKRSDDLSRCSQGQNNGDAMTKPKTTPAPWDEGDKATLLEWYERWKKEDPKPPWISLSAVHFERILEGACYEIQRNN